MVAWNSKAELAVGILYRKDILMDNLDRLADLEQEVKARKSIKTTSWDTFHIPDEAMPKNIKNKYKCSICDRKIPRDNLYCYKCRKEYSISREGVFKYNIPSHEKARLEDKHNVYTEDKSFPIRCTLCRRNRVRRDGGICSRCLKYIGVLEEE